MSKTNDNAGAVRRFEGMTPVGTIVEVHGPVAKIECHPLPPIHEALATASEGESFTLEVHQHLDASHVRAIALHRTAGMRRGLPAFDTGETLRVPVSPNYLGRLLDVFGTPLDGGPSPEIEGYRDILVKPPALSETRASHEILETGIKVVDLLCPFIRGGKTGLFGGAGVGKTVLIMAMEYGAEIALLHVLEDVPGSGDAQSAMAEVKERLTRMIPPEAGGRCTSPLKVRIGKPYQEIIQLAVEDQTDLIVLGVRGRSIVDLALFGSTTYRVIQFGPCPVLTTRL